MELPLQPQPHLRVLVPGRVVVGVAVGRGLGESVAHKVVEADWKRRKNALALFKTFSHKPLAFDDLSFKSTVNRNKVSGQSYKHFMLVNYDSRDVLPLSICRQK